MNTQEDSAIAGIDYEDWSEWIPMFTFIDKLEGIGCGVQTEPAGVVELLRITRNGKSITVGPFINGSASISELYLEHEPNAYEQGRAARKYATTELELIKAICRQMK